jgi:PST family polysaccharide transporter
MLILRLGALMLLARLLTPADFGLVAMVVAFTGALNLFRDLGLSTAAVQRPTVTPELLSTLFWINLAVGAALATLCLAVAPLIAGFYQEPRLQPVAAALAMGFLFHAAGVQHIAMLERAMRFVALAIIELVSLAMSSALGVAAAFQGYGYWSLVIMALAAPIVSTSCAWISTRWVPGLPRKQTEIGAMIRFGGTTTLNGFVVYVAYNLEKVLLGRFWGAEAIGIYGRAYQLVSIPIDNLNNAIGGVAFSALSRLQSDVERLRDYFLKGYSLVLSLTIPTAVAYALLANDIILVVLGAGWNDAAPILRALAPTVVVFALINPLAWLLFALGLVVRSLRIALVLAPLVIVAYIVGLPYGPIGVAVAYSSMMTVWVVPHVVWCVRGTAVSFSDVARAACRPVLSALISGLIVAGLQVYTGTLSPLVRLALCSTVLFGAHFGILMVAMGEKDVYLNIVRGLLKPRAAMQ